MRQLFTYLKLNFDRSFSGKSRNQIVWLLLTISLTIIFLYGIAIILNIQTPSNNINTEENHLLRFIVTLFLDASASCKSILPDRWYALFVSICGITLFTGILISVISNILERRVERYKSGDIRYYLSNHIVVIGFDCSTPSLIAQICSTPRFQNKYILIQSTTPTEYIRDKLCEILNDHQEKRIVIFHARRDSYEELELLNTDKANEIFIIGEDNECEHDFINIECLNLLTKIHFNKECTHKPIPTTVLFSEQSTFALFQFKDISLQWRKYFRFHPINHQQEWAKRVIVTRKCTLEGSMMEYPALDGEGIDIESEEQVHLVIVGMSNMGIALAVEAMHVMHFPNFCRDKKKKTKITFIMPNIETGMRNFVYQHTHFFELSTYYLGEFINNKYEQKCIQPSLAKETDTDFLDIEFTFINGYIESNNVRELLNEWSNDIGQKMSIAISLNNSEQSLMVGLNLPENIYRNNIPIFVHQNISGTLLNIAKSAPTDGRWNKYAHVYPFGMRDNSYEIDSKSIYAAQCTNYIYDYYNTHQQVPTVIETDKVLQQLWEQKEVALQWSNYYNTHSIAPKLRALHIKEGMSCSSLTAKQVNIIAQVEHNRWNVEKLLLGYRKPTFEEERNIARADLKRHFAHPDITPYEKLSEGSKEYDRAITSGIPLVVNCSRYWRR